MEKDFFNQLNAMNLHKMQMDAINKALKPKEKKDNSMTLNQIKKWADEIAGSWNGDESGLQEDMAHQAQDILEAVKNLEDLIEEMDNI